MQAEIISAAASVMGDLGPSRPNYGCQVTVQSEEEKQLKKQVRREERKINRLLNKAGQDEEEEEFVFDPVDLRTKRQAALANAMNTPLFKERQEVREFAVQEQFPFVFDSMNKAKLTSGFIQGTKMSLPTGTSGITRITCLIFTHRVHQEGREEVGGGDCACGEQGLWSS